MKPKYVQIFDCVNKEICNYIEANGSKPKSVLIYIDYDYYHQAIGEMHGDVGVGYELYSQGTVFGYKPCLVVKRPRDYPLVSVITG